MTSELHKIGTNVYCGTRKLNTKVQRGRYYVNFKGKQINIKDIPEKTDHWHQYIFCYGFMYNHDRKLSADILDYLKNFQNSKEKTKTVQVKRKSGNLEIFQIPKDEDVRHYLFTHQIDFTYYKTSNT